MNRYGPIYWKLFSHVQQSQLSAIASHKSHAMLQHTQSMQLKCMFVSHSPSIHRCGYLFTARQRADNDKLHFICSRLVRIREQRNGKLSLPMDLRRLWLSCLPDTSGHKMPLINHVASRRSHFSSGQNGNIYNQIRFL